MPTASAKLCFLQIFYFIFTQSSVAPVAVGNLFIDNKKICNAVAIVFSAQQLIIICLQLHCRKYQQQCYR